MRRLAGAWALVLLPLGQAADGVRTADPAETFQRLEERILGAGEVSLDYRITATGPADIRVEGRLVMEADGTVDLTGTGEFGGQPVELAIRAEASAYRYGMAPDQRMAATPEYLREALVIGMTRMGLLHNLARLTGNAPPDHADGGVRDWVVVSGFTAPEPSSEGAAAAVGFDITVAGRPAGQATLELDAEGRPLVRTQRVQFPQGEMVVVERYSDVRIGG